MSLKGTFVSSAGGIFAFGVETATYFKTDNDGNEYNAQYYGTTTP